MKVDKEDKDKDFRDMVRVTKALLIVNKDLIEKFDSLDKKVKSIDENVDKKVKSIDENVDNKINSKLVKTFGMKWIAIQIIVAGLGLQLLIVFYFNDKAIKSMDRSMNEQTKTLNDYGNTLEGLKKIILKKGGDNE